MPETDRIQRDKATILSIVKYLLFILITVTVVFLGFRILSVLLPFVIGLILARASIFLATVTHNLVSRLRHLKTEPEKPYLIVPLRSEALAALGLDEPEPDADDGQPPTNSDNGNRTAGNRFRRNPARRKHAMRLAVFFYALLVIAVIALFIGVIVISANQLRSLINYVPNLIGEEGFAQQLINSIDALLKRMGVMLDSQTMAMISTALVDLQAKVVAAIPGAATVVLNALAKFVGNLPAVLLIIIVTIMSGYYFITDSQSLYLFLRRNVNSKTFLEKSVSLVNNLSTALFRVIGGYLFLLVITFILVLAGLLVVKMPYAVIIALVAAFVDFLPVLGLSATMVPIIIYMLIKGNIWGAVGVAILWAAITLIRRVIEPPILGSAMSLHPMATLFSMIVGIAIYGLSGILIGPIILVVAKEIAVQFNIDIKLRKLIGEILNRVST